MAVIKCRVEDCPNTGILVRGWCSSHYHRWYRYGNPLSTSLNDEKVTVEDLSVDMGTTITTCVADDCHNLLVNIPYTRGVIKRFCGKTCSNRQSYINRKTADPEHFKKWAHERGFSRYGLTEEEYNDLLEAQNGGCAVCGSKVPGGPGRFHVDHDHMCCPSGKSCGRCVRGLLCIQCNTAAGLLQDDPVRILALLEYIEKRN